MYRKLLPTLALAALALTGGAPAQAQTASPQAGADAWRPCDFDAQQARYFAAHPGEAARYDAMLRDLGSPSAQQRGGAGRVAPDITIPVVVHILYANIPSSNLLPTSAISTPQVNSFIDRVNLDFSKTNADTAAVLPVFVPLIANVGFKFKLARLDPNGQPTTGITRHFSVETNYGTANATSVAYWNPSRYLNVWVVEGIASGAGGYTFGQLCAGSSGGNDGIVIRSSQFGTIGTSGGSNLAARSMTHEIGHYFGLPHTWGRSNTPGLASNCGIDDGIADTPNTAGYNNAGGGCNKTYAPCTDPATNQPILSNVENYMDYADCERMFTLGQRAVMRGLLTDPRFACRATLVSAANLAATGTSDGYVPRIPAPVANFQAARTEVCENVPVQLRGDYYTYNLDRSSGTTTYTWSFPGGTPASATGPTPTVSYATAGYYDVTLTVTNAGGTSTKTISQFVKVSSPAAGLVATVSESFEAPNFFGSNPPPSLLGYTTSGSVTVGNSNLPGYPSTTASWEQIQAQAQPGSDVAAHGNYFLMVRSMGNPASAVSVLTTPNIDVSALTGTAFVQFSRFFGRRAAGNGSETLTITASTDCGVNYTTVANYTAAQLYTTAVVVGGNGPEFVTDWQSVRLNLPNALQGARRLQLRLTFKNGTVAGNNFYLDAFGVGSPLAPPTFPLSARASFAERGIGLYPNPLTHETALHLNLTGPTQVAVRLTDVLGRQLLAAPAKAYAAGEQTIGLPAGAATLSAGLYMVHVSLDGRTFSSKLTVQ